jgi:Arc/MetJ-type ribon-helix-helix transcriptional regulator
MTIHVSKDAENAINAAVQSGLFASADDMVDRLVREFAERSLQRQPAGQGQGSLGAMRDAADELDEAVEHAMNLRQRPWRLPPDE